jgi:hypothetical protein
MQELGAEWEMGISGCTEEEETKKKESGERAHTSCWLRSLLARSAAFGIGGSTGEEYEFEKRKAREFAHPLPHSP